MPRMKNTTVPGTKLRSKLGSPQFYIEDIPGYDAQRKRLWERVKEFTGHPVLMEWAGDFLREYRVPERDPAALARAVQLFAQQHVRFFRERPERFASPMRTIQWGFGDCDDKAVLIATVLRSFRIPVRLAFIRYRARKLDGTFKTISHVYPQVQLGGAWVALESVHPWPMGKDPETEARRKGYSPTVEVIGP